LGNSAPIDRAGDRQVIMAVNDLFPAGTFAALSKQLDGILAFAS
jgi:hypothetical protein